MAQLYQQRLSHVLGRLEALGGGRVLDVGCGPGILLDRLDRQKFEVFGIDYSVEMITEAQSTTAEQSTHLVAGSTEYLPFADDAFDVVVVLGVLEYIYQLDYALKEIARVAKPGALICVSMQNPWSIHWFSCRYVYQPTISLGQLLAQGRVPQHTRLRMRNPKVLAGLMQQWQLKLVSLSYYNFDICPEPVTRRNPKLSSWINKRAERWLGNRPHCAFNTAFLMTVTRLP